MRRKRILIASDIHLCHFDWYGVKADDRLQKFVDDVKAEHKKDKLDALLLLGDYSLDHWKWQIKGSYLEQGVSYTKIFVEKYLSQIEELGIEIRMIAGNHEQYGEEKWKEITGHSRQEYYTCGDYLFVLLDTYAGNLDPTEHSDGTYTGVDMEYLTHVMQKYPQKKVVICAHYLEPWKEKEEFRALLRENERIVCIFAGHTHQSEVWHMEPVYGSKKEIFDGQYGESAQKPPIKSMWGYREVILTKDFLESNYITPENEIEWEGEKIRHAYAKQDGVVIYTEKRK